MDHDVERARRGRRGAARAALPDRALPVTPVAPSGPCRRRGIRRLGAGARARPGPAGARARRSRTHSGSRAPMPVLGRIAGLGPVVLLASIAWRSPARSPATAEPRPGAPAGNGSRRRGLHSPCCWRRPRCCCRRHGPGLSPGPRRRCSSCAGIGALPVAAAIAILRDRLYDIDVVINRALVYGALTATLAAAYLGGVVLTRARGRGVGLRRRRFHARGRRRSSAPRERASRQAVDRRFYRRRYDAARTLAGFGARLRDQVELDALSRELRSVDPRDRAAGARVALAAAPLNPKLME